MDFFEPPAGILSIRSFTLGLDAFAFGWTFLVFPLDSFTSSCPFMCGRTLSGGGSANVAELSRTGEWPVA